MTTNDKTPGRWTDAQTGRTLTTRQLARELRDDAKTDYEMLLGFEISDATAMRLTLDKLAALQGGLIDAQDAVTAAQARALAARAVVIAAMRAQA